MCPETVQEETCSTSQESYRGKTRVITDIVGKNAVDIRIGMRALCRNEEMRSVISLIFRDRHLLLSSSVNIYIQIVINSFAFFS